MSEHNWAGNFAYRAARVHRPQTFDALREVVTGASSLRVLGSRHSFNAIGDADALVSLRALPADVTIDGDSVSFGAGLTYGELTVELDRHGLALHNLASLPHISVAGAIATGTHGSGNANGNLATAVRALELLRSDGEVVRLARGDADFDGAVVGLGALGVITRLTLDVQPTFELRQRVFEGLSWDALAEHFDAITGAGYSVSAFTRLGATVDAVWVKASTDVDTLFDATPATVERHPIIGMDPVNATAQRGVPGPWWDRLPHFRMGFTPSNGEEIQSEYLLPREHAVDAVCALRALGDRLRPVLQVCEIRTIAADALWMSPMYERDTVGFHFTWIRDQEAVETALAPLEAAFSVFQARPHWGKVFLSAPQYPRADDFYALVERFDPGGTFRDAWLRRALDHDEPPRT
ncbi:FAD-binding protein [Solirubrobacter soli]|uniref:FAD-binding protein n=1 Tax=Solirubrobacter soli TaxID=363832 RepID=UPI0004089FE0|nr:FAD-binding protein [Solirubrobacter soli]